MRRADDLPESASMWQCWAAFAERPAIEENNMAPKGTPLDAVNAFLGEHRGQVVLVVQGGGALGAYQGGVYEALHEAGIEPDWVIGTSIGAINAAIGARHEKGSSRLR